MWAAEEPVQLLASPHFRMPLFGASVSLHLRYLVRTKSHPPEGRYHVTCM